MYSAVSRFCIINKQYARSHGGPLVFFSSSTFLFSSVWTSTLRASPSLRCVSAKLQTEAMGWQHLSLLTLRGRYQCNVHSFLQPKRRNGRSGGHLCAVNVLWVDACAQCLRESFKRAWMNSAWQELTPERSTCLHVCVLHECIFLCPTVWERAQMGTNTCTKIRQFVYLGQRNFTCPLICWRALGEELLSHRVFGRKMQVWFLPNYPSKNACGTDHSLTSLNLWPNLQNWLTSLVFLSLKVC